MASITPRGFIYGLGSITGDIPANTTVEALFFNHLAKNLKADTLEFRKQQLKTAIKAFGTVSFYDWYFKQVESPYLTTLHLDFLRDTLNYLSGRSRKYELTVWDALIRRGSQVTPSYILKDDIDLEYFGISASGVVRQPVNRMVKDALKNWITKDNGFNDMLYTLYILTGKER